LPDLQELAGARVAIQGFGDVGAVAAQAFCREGARIIAVSDSQGGILHEDGLDPAQVAAFKAEHGTVVGMPGTRTISNPELLELECDILLPAALGNQIHAGNAGRVQARLVVEGANGPATPGADEILQQRGIYVLPDIVANAGGVIVSYFEWVQNHANESWDAEHIDTRLRQRMHDIVDTVFSRWQSFVVGEEKPATGAGDVAEVVPDFRTVALIIAIERVVRATLMRGIWP
jgi:glutamate dehydrogenase (NAD(P)+)